MNEKRHRKTPYALFSISFLAALVPALLVGCPLQSGVTIVDGNEGILPKNDGVLCKQALCEIVGNAFMGPGSGTLRGTVMISNSNDQLFVTFTPGSGFTLGITRVDVLNAAPISRGNVVGYHSVIGTNAAQVITSITHVFDFGTQVGQDGSTLDVECSAGLQMQTVFIRAAATTFRESDGGGGMLSWGGTNGCDDGAMGVGFASINTPDNRQFAYIEYVVDCCLPSEPVGDNCRTQGQGGWGAPPHGMNPGTIREAVFDACYPEGLILGCNNGGNSILLTSSQAVEDFLPTGGKSGSLHQDYVNPTGKTTAGSLAGHLAALKLSMCAAETLPDFSPCSGVALRGLCYINDNSPMLDGLTVDEIVIIADEIVGGCRNDVSTSEMKNALADISENYTDGGMDLGFLFECS